VGPVTRLLPQRARRSVGPWCFLDLLGPVSTGPGRPGLAVPPHPHCGLQTVTWLLHGEVLHRDSLGSEQVVRPGELSLMTAGHGVAHAEEPTGRALPRLHGAQLWIAQPAATAGGAAAFEHHVDLPVLALPGGGQARVLVGALAGARSPARRDTPHLGAELRLPAAPRAPPARARGPRGVAPRAGRRDSRGRTTGGRLAARRAALRGTPRHVVDLRGPQPGGARRGPPRLASRRAPLRAGRVRVPRLVAPPLPWDTAR
jgi:redox-sensitive bicupin YhaK (pirin superfamily)